MYVKASVPNKKQHTTTWRLILCMATRQISIQLVKAIPTMVLTSSGTKNSKSLYFLDTVTLRVAPESGLMSEIEIGGREADKIYIVSC